MDALIISEQIKLISYRFNRENLLFHRMQVMLIGGVRGSVALFMVKLMCILLLSRPLGQTQSIF